jgi:acyl-CoA synthetase (AMP-forming)/AMP-acid ligase II
VAPRNSQDFAFCRRATSMPFSMAASASLGVPAAGEQCLARFKAPRTVIFGPLPKTSTGKIQKFVLRERAKEIG